MDIKTVPLWSYLAPIHPSNLKIGLENAWSVRQKQIVAWRFTLYLLNLQHKIVFFFLLRRGANNKELLQRVREKHETKN